MLVEKITCCYFLANLVNHILKLSCYIMFDGKSSPNLQTVQL